MTNTILVKRGLEANRSGITPASGELIWTTDDKKLYAGDGATAGGNLIAGTGLTDVVGDTTPQLGGQLDVNGEGFGDGTNLLLDFVEDASAVNYLQIENEAAGSGPILRAVGTDGNIDLFLIPKGTGDVMVPSGYSPDDPFALATKTYVDNAQGITAGTNLNKDGNTINLDTTLVNFASTGIDDNATSVAITIDSSEKIGIGVTSPEGNVHIRTASAGGVTIAAGADELIIENSTDAGLSIITPDSALGALNFGRPFNPNIVVLSPLDTSPDDIILPATGTLGSQASMQTVEKKFGAGSVEFTPSGSVDPALSFLSYPDNSSYTIGTNQFTIEFWVRFKSLTTTNQSMASVYLNTGNQRSWFIRRNGNSCDFIWYSDGASAEFILGDFTWAIDTWYHIAATRDSSDDVRLFVDGTQVATTNSSTSIHNSSSVLRLGKVRSAAADDFPMNGFIDDFRFIVGEAIYTSNFTPPTKSHSLLGTQGYVTYDHSTDLMQFGTSGLDRMTIDSAGDVSINASLDVNNSIDIIDTANDGSVDIGVIAGTATNVDLLISPAGTGDVMVPSGYIPTDPYSLVTRTYVDSLGNLESLISFRGVLVFPSANTAITNNTFTTLSFDSEVYDTNAFHDTVTNNSRLTIPAALDGKRVIVQAGISWESNTTADRAVRISKNGSVTSEVGLPEDSREAISGGRTFQNITSAPLIVSTGDYFEVQAWQNSGSDKDVLNNPQTWFALEIVVEGSGSVDDSLTITDAANDGVVQLSVATGTATNVDLLISPAGTGNVMVPSGYTPDDPYALVTKTYVDGVSGSRGALVSKSTDQTSITSFVILTFDQEEYDTDDIHDNSTNNSRLTVPAGVTQVRILGNMRTSAGSTFSAFITIQKNGSSFPGAASLSHDSGFTNTDMNIHSPVLHVTPGDYFEMGVQFTVSHDVLSHDRTWFAMEIVL